MAKGKRKKRKPGTSGHSATAANVDAIVADAAALRLQLDSSDAGATWGQIQMLLLKAKLDPSAIAAAVANRDVDAIDRLLAILRGEAVEVITPEPAALPEFPFDVLREAMKAFRKRMKLTRLDHESKLGRSPLTGGKDAAFDSILPPEKVDPDVWRVLVARGDLQSTGRGFYKLPDEHRSF